jgi:hypothetical protein
LLFCAAAACAAFAFASSSAPSATPAAAASYRITQRIFTSNKEGTLSVLHEATPERYETVQTLTTGPGARTIAADEKTGHLFLPTARMGPAKAGGAATLMLPETFAVLVVGVGDGR